MDELVSGKHAEDCFPQGLLASYWVPQSVSRDGDAGNEVGRRQPGQEPQHHDFLSTNQLHRPEAVVAAGHFSSCPLKWL